MQAIYESDYEDLLTTPAGDTWTCSNDQQAEWAVKRMRFAARKRDRLLAGIREEIETMQRRAEQIEQDYADDTAFFRCQLMAYMATVDVEETKTQQKYELPSGTVLRRKSRAPEFVRDEEKLLSWAKETGNAAFVRVKETPNWSEIKSAAVVNDGQLITKNTGEIIPGVTVTQREPEFIIDTSRVEPALKEV